MDNKTNNPVNLNLPNATVDPNPTPPPYPSDTTIPPATPPPDLNSPEPSWPPAPSSSQPPVPDPSPSFSPTWPSIPQAPIVPEQPPVPEPIAPTSPPQDTTPPSSPLDNPWGASFQPPPINGSESQPVEPAAPELTETAPTDLSHLIESDTINKNAPIEPQPTVTTAETLVAPPTNNTAEVPNLPTESNHGKIPKWVIGLGIGLLILVIGASAYFILGIGQPPKAESIPASQAPKQEIKAPPPVAQPSPQGAATGSASFGELEGSKQATSAADLLRQRQQQGL